MALFLYVFIKSEKRLGLLTDHMILFDQYHFVGLLESICLNLIEIDS